MNNTDQQLQQICSKIAQNITIDTALDGKAEQAAQVQYMQLVNSGMPEDVANAIIQMVMEVLTA